MKLLEVIGWLGRTDDDTGQEDLRALWGKASLSPEADIDDVVLDVNDQIEDATHEERG